MAVDISVVIPLYNKSDFVRKALRSAVEQSYKPREVIVVDDGSSDDSLLVVRNFKEESIYPNIKIISQHNQGVSKARNTGIESASFDYIALLDADDEWDCFILDESIGGFRIGGASGSYQTFIENYYVFKKHKVRFIRGLMIVLSSLGKVFIVRNMPRFFVRWLRRIFGSGRYV